MNAAVRPILLPGDRALRHLEALVQDALQPWCREWLARPDAPQPVRARPGVPSDVPAVEMTEWCGVGGRVWTPAEVSEPTALVDAVFPGQADEAADTWTLTALAEAAAGRDRCAAEAIVGEIVSTHRRWIDPALHAFGSGAVVFDAPAIGLLLVADGSALAHVPPPERDPVVRAPSVPVEDAARDAVVRLVVELGRVELDVARLLDLQPGDVLRLPSALTERLPVLLDDRAVATGALCHAGGHKAVQLHPIRPQHRDPT